MLIQKKLPLLDQPKLEKIIQSTATQEKKLTMELGGKSPFIVFEDADLDSAVEGVVDAIWFNQGQVCCAGSRLLVQESVEKIFIRKLKARMEKLRVGNPLDKSIDIGAIVAPVQLKKIQSIVKRVRKKVPNYGNLVGLVQLMDYFTHLRYLLMFPLLLLSPKLRFLDQSYQFLVLELLVRQ